MNKYALYLQKMEEHLNHIIVKADNEKAYFNEVASQKQMIFNTFIDNYSNERQNFLERKQNGLKRIAINEYIIQERQQWIDYKKRILKEEVKLSDKIKQSLNLSKHQLKDAIDAEVVFKKEAQKACTVSNQFNDQSNNEERTQKKLFENQKKKFENIVNIPNVHRSEKKCTIIEEERKILIKIEKGNSDSIDSTYEKFELFYSEKDKKYVLMNNTKEELLKAVNQFNFHKNLGQLQKDFHMIVNFKKK